LYKVGYSLEERLTKERLVEFCKRNHIRRLSLFGSALRDQLGPDSDIDLLVEFEPDHTPGLFSMVRMELELTEMLGRKADLRTAEDLSEYFRDEVVENAQVQYQA
jgi:predicted nucleotidyltransferase